MWLLMSDENFNGDILRGIFLRRADFDIVRVQDIGLEGADDPTILARAAQLQRVLLTHDRATIPDFAYQRVIDGLPMPGVIIVNDRLPLRQVIEDILVLTKCSQPSEWENIVLYLPL